MMTVNDMIRDLPAQCLAGQAATDTEICGGYSSDLLSNVMGQARQGFVWITMQGHRNIIAVAALTGLAAILLAGGVQPEQETIDKANQEAIPLLITELSVFEAAGRLYEMGVREV